MGLRPGHDESLTGGENEPWLAKGAIEFLDKEIKPHMIGLEWGAGSSTPWFAQRLARLTTIEHEPSWAIKVIEEMDRSQRAILDRWRLLLVPPEKTADPERIPGDQAYLGADGRFYRDYVLAGAKAWSCDFVCIDGRARNACLWTAICSIAIHDAILVMDNSDRPYDLSSIPDWWERHDFHNGVWQTTVWLSR